MRLNKIHPVCSRKAECALVSQTAHSGKKGVRLWHQLHTKNSQKTNGRSGPKDICPGDISMYQIRYWRKDLIIKIPCLPLLGMRSQLRISSSSICWKKERKRRSWHGSKATSRLCSSVEKCRIHFPVNPSAGDERSRHAHTHSLSVSSEMAGCLPLHPYGRILIFIKKKSRFTALFFSPNYLSVIVLFYRDCFDLIKGSPYIIIDHSLLLICKSIFAK